MQRASDLLGLVETNTGLSSLRLSNLLLLLLQPLRWRCVGCAIHHERDVGEEQHPYISGAINQQ